MSFCQVLGKRREPPSHDLPAPANDAVAVLGSHPQPAAQVIREADNDRVLQRLQEDLQRFRCFSSLNADGGFAGAVHAGADGAALGQGNCAGGGRSAGVYCPARCSAAAAVSSENSAFLTFNASCCSTAAELCRFRCQPLATLNRCVCTVTVLIIIDCDMITT